MNFRRNLKARGNPELRPCPYGKNLAGMDLSGQNLSFMDLAGADFRGADLTKTRLSGSDLSGADLSDQNMERTRLSEAILRGANLNNATFHGELRYMDLSGADLRNADFNSTDFTGSNLRDVKAARAEFTYANLTLVNLSNADLSRANLQSATLTSAVLEKATLRNALANYANFNLADLTDADLQGANLENSDLTEMKVAGANFKGAKLTDANLAGTNLSLANMQGVVIPEPHREGPLREHYVISPPTSAAFQRWFGKSVTIDHMTGQPIVVYHGTRNGGFTIFDPTKLDARHNAFYFSDALPTSETYTNSNKPLKRPDPAAESSAAVGIYRVYIKLVNPMIINGYGARWNELSDNRAPGLSKTFEFTKWAEKHGYDGVIFKDIYDDGGLGPYPAPIPATVYAVFDPRAIKSATANNGNYDPNDPDIRHNPRRPRRKR